MGWLTNAKANVKKANTKTQKAEKAMALKNAKVKKKPLTVKEKRKIAQDKAAKAFLKRNK